MREQYDSRIAAFEKGGEAAIDQEQIDKINAAISAFEKELEASQKALAASTVLGSMPDRVVNQELTNAYNAYMRTGEVNALLQKDPAEDGGYLAPIEWDRTIESALKEVSPMRQLCNVKKISTAGFSRVFNKRGTTSGWVDDTDEGEAGRPETDTASFGSMDYIPH